MFTFIADAFLCFVQVVLVIAVIFSHSALLHEDDTPISIITYSTCSTLALWSGNIKTFLCVTIPFYALVISLMTLYHLTYSLTFAIFTCVVCWLVMGWMWMTSPTIRRVG